MKAEGYVCDLASCKRFEYAQKEAQRAPIGWFSVQPVTGPVPLSSNATEAAKKAAAEHEPGLLHLCSTRCIAEWALQRYEAENDGKRLVRSTQKGVPKKRKPKATDEVAD